MITKLELQKKSVIMDSTILSAKIACPMIRLILIYPHFDNNSDIYFFNYDEQYKSKPTQVVYVGNINNSEN